MRLLLLGALGASVACGGGGDKTPTVTPPPFDTTLTVSVPPSVAIGGSLQALAQILPGGSAIWASESPTTASVTSDGMITGTSGGVATIRATIGSKIQKDSLEVYDPAFVS